MSPKTNFLRLSPGQLLVLLFFTSGTVLRILLCWVNPPQNTFDNHFEPILMIMKSGAIPAKDACFQCYHPPVFYWVSAVIGSAASRAGLTLPHVIKVLQFVGCFFGIATVGVCWLLLKKIPVSNFSKLVAFGTVCFLPRHIYSCAMNSNDTISYFFVGVSLYLALVAFERGLSPVSLCALSAVLAITLFTKYTAFAVIPAVVAGFLSVWRQDSIVSRKRVVLSLLAVLVLPMSLLSGYMISNLKHHQSPLPWNISMYDPSMHRPRDEGGISFVSFKPWEEIRRPLLVPGQLHSFWTLIYGGMWFDTEPYFVSFLDSDRTWWKSYYRWYRGEGPFPGENVSRSSLAVVSGGGLVALGLVPLALILVGCYLCVGGKWHALWTPTSAQRAALAMFPTLLAFNVAGVIAMTLRLPVYNTMKPSYLLSSTPAFMICLSLGIMLCEKNKILKGVIFTISAALFSLVSVHILHIVLAIRSLQAHLK